MVKKIKNQEKDYSDLRIYQIDMKMMTNDEDRHIVTDTIKSLDLESAISLMEWKIANNDIFEYYSVMFIVESIGKDSASSLLLYNKKETEKYYPKVKNLFDETIKKTYKDKSHG